MLEHLRPADSLVWTIAWQSSAFLALGLAASLALRKRPARAHGVLLAAMVAALISPALTETGRRLEWGLWDSPSAASASPSSFVPSGRSVSGFGEEDRGQTPPARRPSGRATFEAPGPVQVAPPIAVRATLPSFSWRSVFLIGWAGASVVLFAKLIVSFLGGWRLARSAREADEPAVRAWVAAAAERLGLRAAPRVRRLSAVGCPAVWCWGRAPLLLLPEDHEAEGVDWVGVFRHELAHWARRDHISALLGEILVCALPWSPLTWWSRGRLGQLAELACDDWALASGISPADYAEALLALRPQGRSTPALAAVSNPRGLMNRVRRILADGRREPAVGARWTVAVCLGLVAAVSALALAQARPARARADDAPKADQAGMKTLRGTVLAPDGEPLAGASVVWIGNRKPPLPLLALPKGSPDSEPKIETIAQARTGDDGTFELVAPFRVENYARYNGVNVRLIVAAPGRGLLARPVSAGDFDAALALKVPERVVIHGRLLASDGTPAMGVRAMFGGFDTDVTGDGMFIWRPGIAVDRLPPSWPRPQETDAEGRFTIEGVPAGAYAWIIFEHPSHAVDYVVVDTALDRAASPSPRVYEPAPVEPTFTYTLKPARPVAGRVTDKETGKPLANVFIQMTPTRRGGGYPFTTRTDADGRYRVAGHSVDAPYLVTAYPPADSGHRGSNARRDWPAGADLLTVDLALDKGRLVHGRVVDQDGDRPVPGAAVIFQSDRRERAYAGDYDLSNTVLTDADGLFAITTLPGKGFLAVETGSDAYIRTPLDIEGRSPSAWPQGFARIDVPKEGEPAPVKIVMRKGVPLEARVVDPEGRPVSTVTAMYPGIDAVLITVRNVGQEFPGGNFRIPGADPDKTYRVFFTNVERRLGAAAELKRDPTGEPLEVRLQPTATVRGKIANPHNEPLPKESTVSMSLLLNPDRAKRADWSRLRPDDYESYWIVLGQRHFFFQRDQPKSDGSFEFDALIPGVDFLVFGYAEPRLARVPVWNLKPGEIRDLGTVTLDQAEKR